MGGRNRLPTDRSSLFAPPPRRLARREWHAMFAFGPFD